MEDYIILTPEQANAEAEKPGSWLFLLRKKWDAEDAEKVRRKRAEDQRVKALWAQIEQLFFSLDEKGLLSENQKKTFWNIATPEEKLDYLLGL